MNHPTHDELLLLAYGELSGPRSAEIESHLAACRACGAALAELERGRVALDVALPPRSRSATRWIAVALAAAALFAGVVVTKQGPTRNPTERWTPTTTWSATAGYVAGGSAMIDIDAQLTRLEQERTYGLPN
ncbi:MAG TPA: zf-HC2 domain-containing protein [Gemmatimonadales bacterium]